MTLFNYRFSQQPRSNKNSSTTPDSAGVPVKKSRWLAAAYVAAVAGASWLAFDIPAPDARSIVASLTPIAAMHCVGARSAAIECTLPDRGTAKPVAGAIPAR
jgi:hypothetical protein